MNTGRIQSRKVLGLTAIAAMGAFALSAINLSANAAMLPPKQGQVNLINTGVVPTHTDLSTLIIAGYEYPDPSRIVPKPASAP